jgi:hypothetical protein
LTKGDEGGLDNLFQRTEGYKISKSLSLISQF